MGSRVDPIARCSAPRSGADDGWRDVALFGLSVSTNFPFATGLASPNGAPELILEVTAHPPRRLDWDGLSPAYESAIRLTDGRCALKIFRLPEVDVLRFPDEADFYCFPERIVCHALDEGALPQIEIHLLGTLMTFWMERRGIAMLHASAVELNGRAVAFLASNKGGKSSLAAGFLQEGHALLTDDILPLESTADGILGRPGYPSMRLWPELARHFAGGLDHLQRVHPQLDKRRVPVGQTGGLGRFCNRPLPIACLYLPERQEGGAIAIEPVRPQRALAELVRHSFAPRIVQALGWQGRRMGILAHLLRQAPLRRLTYPSGIERLDSVRAAIRDDLRRHSERTRR